MRQNFDLRAVSAALVMAFAATVSLAGSGHDMKPRYGGVVVETRAGELEVVAKPDSMQIYLTDHGKAVKLDGAKAKVTLLNGTEKSEADLVATAGKLEAKGAFNVVKGTKGIAVVTLAGKAPVTARFDIKK